MKQILPLLVLVSSALAAEIIKSGDGECVAPTTLVDAPFTDLTGTWFSVASFQQLFRTDCHKMKLTQINETTLEWKIVWKGLIPFTTNVLNLVLEKSPVNGIYEMYLRGLISRNIYLGRAYIVQTQERLIICSCRSGNLVITTNLAAQDCYVATKDENLDYDDTKFEADKATVIAAKWDGGFLEKIRQSKTQCSWVRI